MDLVFSLLAGVMLLATNFFFVMSEFALVRVRPARATALAEAGDRRARILVNIQERMEEYLSVVQIGITGATLGVGVIIDEGIGRALAQLFGDSTPLARGASVVLAFLIATYLTIVSSELVPKALALRYTERIALLVARPMWWLHKLFYPLLIVLSRSARAVLALMGTNHGGGDAPHSEDELRIILSESHEGGIMPFRRLLMFENVFDLGSLTVRDAMRPRHRVVTLATNASRADVVAVARKERFSRYPLLAPGAKHDAFPLGVVHAKDVLCAEDPLEMGAITRPFPRFSVHQPLEQALEAFQRSRNHLAMVEEDGHWVGIITFEDVIEEIIGQVEDEFERDEPLHLDALIGQDHIFLDLPAHDLEDAIPRMLAGIPAADIPTPPGREKIELALRQREHALTSYVGKGIALPHVRVDGLARPMLIFARLAKTLPVPGRSEAAHFIFLMLTPSGSARVHLRLMARIAHLAESDYILERLAAATTTADIAEAIAAGDRLSTG